MTTTITIDRQTAIDLMKRAVDEKGEGYIYPGSESGNCQYQNGGAPSCLVGHALAYAGVSIETLERMDRGMTDDGREDSNIAILLTLKGDKLPFKATPAAREAFAAAQQRQDCGDTWGYALESAAWSSVHERDLA